MVTDPDGTPRLNSILEVCWIPAKEVSAGILCIFIVCTNLDVMNVKDDPVSRNDLALCNFPFMATHVARITVLSLDAALHVSTVESSTAGNVDVVGVVGVDPP